MLIPTNKNVKTITDLREKALELLNSVEKEGIAYIFHRSKPRAVMMNIDEFVHLQELLEEHLDELDAKDLEKEPRGKGIPLKKIMKKYG